LRKTFTIILLSVYLFNLAGYSLFFHLLISRADNHLEAVLDKGAYADSELIEIKVALNLPYLPSNNEYEPISGHVMANGKYYNYVKRKVSTDAVYFYCIPNQQANDLIAAKKLYSKQANDLPASQKEKDLAKKGSTAFQYNETIPEYTITMPADPTLKLYGTTTYLLSSLPVPAPYQPPEV
jgi:hypothetical protein